MTHIRNTCTPMPSSDPVDRCQEREAVQRNRIDGLNWETFGPAEKPTDRWGEGKISLKFPAAWDRDGEAVPNRAHLAWVLKWVHQRSLLTTGDDRGPWMNLINVLGEVLSIMHKNGER